MSFDLSSISRTARTRAPKIVVVGEGKVGKSSFAAGSPSPVFIRTEDGLDALSVDAFPLAQSLDDVYSAMGVLLSDEHEFRTLVIDSLDWLEPLVNDHVCRQNRWSNIEAPGYGKGYVAAAAEWRTLLEGLDALRNQRGMGVVLICHDQIKRIESPLHEGYDAYALKLHRHAAGLVLEWADIIGFATYRIALRKTDTGFGNHETKAISTGERVLRLEANPAHPGGNRFGMKDVPLSWDDFAAALDAATTTKTTTTT